MDGINIHPNLNGESHPSTMVLTTFFAFIHIWMVTVIAERSEAYNRDIRAQNLSYSSQASRVCVPIV